MDQDRSYLIESVQTALGLLTVHDLKKLPGLLPGDRKPTRKADLIAEIEKQLDAENLKALWERLDETQRLAVAESIYSDGCVFETERFRAKRAKYEKLPVFGTR